MEVGNVILYKGSKYKVIKRYSDVFVLRHKGLFGVFRKDVQVFFRDSTLYYLIKR